MTSDIENDDDFTGDTAPADRIARVEQQLAIAGLRSDHGLSTEQAEKVHALIARSGLDADEALTVAQRRHPDLFGARPQGAQFGQLAARGGAGRHEQPSDWEQRRVAIDKLKTVDRRASDRLWENAVGSHMAAALGWEHVKLPIPRV